MNFDFFARGTTVARLPWRQQGFLVTVKLVSTFCCVYCSLYIRLLSVTVTLTNKGLRFVTGCAVAHPALAWGIPAEFPDETYPAKLEVNGKKLHDPNFNCL